MEKICLIVDDEPSIRAYLKAVLQLENFQALEADTAPQAFRLVQKLNGGLDLVVTDVPLPGDMNGQDLAFAIRKSFPAIPVVVISGYAFPNQRSSEFEYIEKPFNPEAILKLVKKLSPAGKKRPAES